MVRKAENYAWSSAAARCGLRNDPLLSPLPEYFPVKTGDWSGWLAEKDDERMVAAIRLRTRTGRPAGNRKFVARMETLTKRRLQPRMVGRPEKKRA
jgi:hypothetical protein